MSVIVTGGGRGIGRAIALKLSHTFGPVAVVSRSSEQVADTVDLIHSAGGRALGVVADVADDTAVRSMAREVEEKLGAVDLLVNNAGVAGPFDPLETANAMEWWRCIEVNLRGPFLCTQAVVPAMLARGGGRIVNVASGAGTVALPNMSAYVVSKTALIRMTELLDLEAGERGVKAFAISPGTVRTAMTDAGRVLPFIAQIFAEGRDVSPDVCADLVSRLASGECDVLSGSFLHVEDDIDAMLQRGAEGRQFLRMKRGSSS